MNKTPLAKRAQIINLLVEGNSLRATARLADCALNTVTRVLEEAGAACAEYQCKTLRNLKSERIQCDEIWAFCGKKEKRASDDEKEAGTAGDIWTWTAIDADSKLMVTWLVGRRDPEHGIEFMHDLKSRLSDRVQLTTDAFGAYRNLVANAFKRNVDYAQLVKVFSNSPGNGRYSPGECCGTKKKILRGDPDPNHISTSYAERANLTMRMGMRRMTRLTNGFSKKAENHAHAVALHFMYYNFGRVHKTLKVTPAMQAGIANHVWSLTEIAALVPEPVAKPRGPYKNRAKTATADQEIST
jgi:IS1 family transposase